MADAKVEEKDLYRVALDTRNFEIKLFWQRCNYFLVLNSALAVGFFTMKETKYSALLAVIGIITSVLWFAVGLGSKFWQVRWEYRLKKIEERLYPGLDFFSASGATNKSDVAEELKSSQHGWFRRCLNRLTLLKLSVSLMMMLLSLVFIVAWGVAMALSTLGFQGSTTAAFSTPPLTTNAISTSQGVAALQVARTMTTSEIINAVINGLIALGTILVAIFAIWGDYYRARWYGPKLSIVPHNLRGEVGQLKSGRHPIYYHLKVTNARRTVPATHCIVRLKEVRRKSSTGNFENVSSAVPLEFTWAPEGNDRYITLVNDHVFDFGRVIEGENRFSPCLTRSLFAFKGFVYANDVVQYGLEIVSDNFVSPHLQIFEVAWNGQWSDDLDAMADHLRIREVTSEASDA
jgi:hypothetical protein